MQIGSKLVKDLDVIRSDDKLSLEDPPLVTLGSAERCAKEPVGDGGICGFHLPIAELQPITEPITSAGERL